ncbi:hypothetical protein CFC21_110306 [Triticum aestivum]|uniref:4-hydroxy-7-methoxy-3-oxo-3,4-dihydro-2H-1,4-benzoxazin-2-yl glucosidebeta-D-glucosidase n=2 Tax=Triticum aestivum TaxID=4565 RepID=A0A3B6TI88_WHEAT|nr:hypothetical protein CFC21_110306 [Triticum aestivum]
MELLRAVVLLSLALLANGRDTDLSRDSFPKGFVFGTASSAYQVEGNSLKYGRGPCIWDTFLKFPGATPDNATANVTVDEYHRYMDDVDSMVRVGFDAYRFSISWSRIFRNGIGRFNKDGVDYYHRLIDYMLANNITPYVVLYHYDLPEVLNNQYNGWLSPKVVPDFMAFADFCFKTYGNRVKNWFTINEPRMMAWHGYGDGFFAPGRCTGCRFGGNSATEPYIAGHHLILAHAAAVQVYRDKYQRRQNGTIGILLDFVWYEPLTYTVEDEYATHRAREFTLGWYMHPITFGHYPETMRKLVGSRLPNFTAEQSKLVQGSADIIGVNHYTTYYVRHHENLTHMSYATDWQAELLFERNGVPIGRQVTILKSHHQRNKGWARICDSCMNTLHSGVLEVAVRGALGVLQGGDAREEQVQGPLDPHRREWDRPVGQRHATHALYDTFRIDYFDQYLHELKRAIADGARVTGYFAWSLLDNFEWRMGFTSKFGLVYVDRKTFTRYPKDSTRWFRKVIKSEEY